MWKVKGILLITTTAASLAAGLEIEGNAAFGKAEIEVAAAGAAGVDVAAVERLYLRAGYLDAAAQLVEEEGQPPRLPLNCNHSNRLLGHQDSPQEGCVILFSRVSLDR